MINEHCPHGVYWHACGDPLCAMAGDYLNEKQNILREYGYDMMTTTQDAQIFMNNMADEIAHLRKGSMNNYKYEVMILTASSYNNKVSVELPVDSDAHEVFAAFKTLMVGLTFHQNSFDDAVVKYFYDRGLDRPEDDV